jgi:polysaccharide biosynthesis PFTS motif protein
LDYDQFVVWSPFLAQYFSSHPGSARRFQVTGCLWADYIQPRRDVLVKMSAELQEWLQGKKVVAAFDSTYSRRGYTSYQEGILFARHILLLADMSADLVVLWKEKKPRGVHYQLDDGSADELLAVYAKLDGHPRVMNVTSVLTAGDMVSVADLVISFPFTSTSLEALSAHRRAVWHDPLAFYKRSVYSDRLVTHGWEELRVLVDCLLRGEDLSLAEADTKMMDPYCDGRAVERFRKLLAEA